MKIKTYSAIQTFLFMILLVAPTIMYWIEGENQQGLLDEKRELSAFPQSFSDHYLQDLENWYNDHVPYRLTIITKQKEISQVYGTGYRKVIHPFLSKLFTPLWYKDEEYSARIPGQTEFFAPIEDNGAVYGRDDWLFYTKENNMCYFTRTNIPPEESINIWKKNLQSLNDVCVSKGIRLVVLLAPNKEQVYGEYVPSYYIEAGESRAERFYNSMKHSSVNFLYPIEELKSARKYYDTYYRQDTHWNEFGAYIASVEIMKSLEKSIPSIEELDIQTTIKTGGDLSNFLGYATDYNDCTINYKPELEVTEESFENGFVEVFSSTADTDKKLVMLSDSFRHTIKKYLSKEFSMSIIADSSYINHVKVKDALQSLGKDDVLLLLHVERYDDAFPAEVPQVIKLLYADD